jgi:hypothetical protein
MRVVKPDAEEIDDHVFRAIHCPTRLLVGETADGPRIGASADDLIGRFLDSHRDYVQAVVLGESGTGKSHLIQWLRLNIPDDPSTVKLTIPKAGTSLRGIVERLIGELPPSEQAPFGSRLRQSGTYTATQAAKVDRFLDALAWSVEHASVVRSEAEEGLRELLPTVFRDPSFRSGFFRTPGGTVDQFVYHLFVDPDKRGGEEVREFQKADLPLDGRFYHQAAFKTKEAIDFIRGEPGMDGKAIALMNACLDTAIAQTLNFTADNLIELMSALRRHLARQGKRLVLLIEDFARLQGIDTALLQALITPPSQGAERLCELRWAMAVTTGYFLRLDSTVRTRTTLLVDMDQSAPASVTEMTARYLNAVRVGESALGATMEEAPIPNRCATCPLKPPCWKAFGSNHEIGLFPLTEVAIDNMARRTGASAEGRFNPRKYLRSVLEPVLLTQYQELQNGEFPSRTFLERIGGPSALSPADRLWITNRDDTTTAERRIALLELWDGTGQVVNLEPGIHSAFGLPLLQGDVPTVKPLPPGLVVPPVVSKATAINYVDDVAAWSNGSRVLPQNAVNTLRALLYAALEGFIDWDALGIRKSEVATAKGAGSVPFRQLSINFHNQQAQATPSLVTLQLPLDTNSSKDWQRTAVALEALLTYDKLKVWDFDKVELLLPTLLEALNDWAFEITRQLRELFGSRKHWNPVIAAAELLALAAYQSGRLPVDARTDALIARVWDESEPPVLEGLHAPFTQANKRLASQWKKLNELVRSLCSGTKGGQAGNYINPVLVSRAIRSLRHRSLKLAQTVPVDLKGAELKTLGELYESIKTVYPPAMDAEKQAWLSWRAQIERDLGPDGKVSDLVTRIREAVVAFENAGLPGGATLRDLRTEMDATSANAADRCLEHARALDGSNAADAIARIAIASKEHDGVDRLIARANSYLAEAERAVQNRLDEERQKTGAGLEQSLAAIESSLSTLSMAITTLLSTEGPSK